MVGQLVVFSSQVQGITPQYTQYTPSLIEIVVGAGVIAYATLAFTLGVRYLRIVDYEFDPEEEHVPQQDSRSRCRLEFCSNSANKRKRHRHF